MLEPGFYLDARGAMQTSSFEELCEMAGLPPTPENLAKARAFAEKKIHEYLSRPHPAPGLLRWSG